MTEQLDDVHHTLIWNKINKKPNGHQIRNKKHSKNDLPGIRDETKLEPEDISKLLTVFCIHRFTSTSEPNRLVRIITPF